MQPFTQPPPAPLQILGSASEGLFRWCTQAIEEKILSLLGSAAGNILDNEVLINTLAQSKATSTEIVEELKAVEESKTEMAEVRIDLTSAVGKSRQAAACTRRGNQTRPFQTHNIADPQHGASGSDDHARRTTACGMRRMHCCGWCWFWPLLSWSLPPPLLPALLRLLWCLS